MESHTLMDGKVHVYRRENSGFWQVRSVPRRAKSPPDDASKKLALAMDFAREWYMERYADDRLRRRGLPLPTDDERAAAGEPLFLRPRPKAKPAGPTFRDAADVFVAEYGVITHGERNAEYVEGKSRHLRLYLLPYFGDRPGSRRRRRAARLQLDPGGAVARHRRGDHTGDGARRAAGSSSGAGATRIPAADGGQPSCDEAAGRTEHILVNAIAPGPFATQMMASTLAERGHEIRETNPLARVGQTEDIAGVAIFLGSRASAYTTGAVVPCDGGVAEV